MGKYLDLAARLSSFNSLKKEEEDRREEAEQRETSNLQHVTVITKQTKSTKEPTPFSERPLSEESDTKETNSTKEGLEASKRRLEYLSVSLAVWPDGSMRIVTNAVAWPDGAIVYSPREMFDYIQLEDPAHRNSFRSLKAMTRNTFRADGKDDENQATRTFGFTDQSSIIKLNDNNELNGRF